MLEIRLISLIPFATALLAAFLAASTLRVPRRGERTILYFFLLNIANMLWAFFYAVEINLDTTVVLDVAPIGSAAWIVYVFEIIGLAAAPTYWLLFAASYAHKDRLSRGWGASLVHIPFVYTVVVAVTNPVHQLFVSQAGPGQPVGYGPLAYPHLVGTFVLVAWGAVLLVGAVLRPGTRMSRMRAGVLAVAIFTPIIGGLAWALRGPLDLPLEVHPVPLLFTLTNVVFLYMVLADGLADIIPIAAIQAFKTMSDAVLVVDSEGVIVALNPAAARLFPGVDPRVLLATASPAIAEHVEPFVASGDDYGEFELLSEHAVHWGRTRRTRDSQGRVLGLIVLLTDVTELRAAQLELEDLNETLRDRVRDLHRERSIAEERGRQLYAANLQLEEATQSKSRFLANMSHELRTPLNSIIGFSSVLLKGVPGELNSEQHTQVEMVNTSGRRLLSLIDDILDLSKTEAGRVEVRLERVVAESVLESVRRVALPLCTEKGLSLKIRVMGDAPSLVTDPRRVEQILVNLVTNAVKYTDFGGIVIEAEVAECGFQLRVIDSGVGIPAEATETIFAEFEQLSRANGTKRPGAGLGLAISRQLARLLSGDLSVNSQVGRGSTFTLTLPRD